jgi:probable F420-dependent oxidoreductase
LPTHGNLPETIGIAAMAARLEAAGFDSLWVSDHVITPSVVHSRYPYSVDGTISWPTRMPFFDCVIALAIAAASTRSIELGTAALVLPLRQPVVLAKQLASIDVVAAGRLTLGVGAGWMREEFEVLGVDFTRRGRIEEEAMSLLRECWTGRLVTVPGLTSSAVVECYPLPAHPIPVLVGGMAEPALRRAGRIGDGWLAQQSPDFIDPDQIERSLATIHSAAEESGRRLTSDFRVVLRVGPASHVPEPIVRRLNDLTDAGVTDLIVDANWDAADGPRRVKEALAIA